MSVCLTFTCFISIDSHPHFYTHHQKWWRYIVFIFWYDSMSILLFPSVRLSVERTDKLGKTISLLFGEAVRKLKKTYFYFIFSLNINFQNQFNHSGNTNLHIQNKNIERKRNLQISQENFREHSGFLRFCFDSVYVYWTDRRTTKIKQKCCHCETYTRPKTTHSDTLSW